MTTDSKLYPGMVLGRYELLLPIAQGGMATVWAARQKGSRGFTKTVAIKTMLPGLSDDPQFEEMFLDEAGLAAKIQHPNVAQILDLGEENEVLYIVMEWIDGEALSVVATAAKKANLALPHSIILRIISQACAGLHAAHELKDENDHLVDLVHRDVSPQNILVTYDGIVKLVDFGVAKAVGRVTETQGGQLKGKVPYMSPEQARGAKVDRRTDIFALGIVLYKLTLGVHPFVGVDDLATMRNIVSRPLLPPRVKDPSFSPELEQVLLRCLEKDPDRRFQTMLELDRALERVLASTGVSLVDDEVGSFVRSLLGDRGQRRRTAIRDAVKAADERAAGLVVHDQVSEVVMTNVSSGIRQGTLTAPLSIGGLPPPTPPPSIPGLSQRDGTASGPPTAQLLAPVELSSKRGRSGVFVALGGLVVAAGIGAFLLRFSASGPEADPKAQGAASPEPTQEAKSVASVAAAPSAVAAAPSAVAAASATPATAMNVNDLPDDKPIPGGAPKKPGGPGKASETAAASTAEPKATTKPTTNRYVPKVTNPGF